MLREFRGARVMLKASSPRASLAAMNRGHLSAIAPASLLASLPLLGTRGVFWCIETASSLVPSSQ
jgi:hypothetical protein